MISTAGDVELKAVIAQPIPALVLDVTDEEAARSDFGSYTEAQFFDDMARVTQYRTNPDLCEVIVKRSLDTLTWMRGKGVRFLPYYGRQSFKVDGRVKFWGGLTITVSGGGIGVVDALFAAAKRDGVRVNSSHGISHSVSAARLP